MAEGEKIENAASYCYGVAKFVWIEASRGRAKEPVELDENTSFQPHHQDGGDEIADAREAVERRLDCLENCSNNSQMRPANLSSNTIGQRAVKR
jgi:hypothetical protein